MGKKVILISLGIIFLMPASLSAKDYDYDSKFPIKVPTFKPFELKGYKRREIEKDELEKKYSPTIKPRSKTSDNEPAPIIIHEKPARVKPIIVIDAGHGGMDPGAIGKAGTQEKDITLNYAKSLKNMLEGTMKYDVVLTRSTDVFVNLDERVRIARKADGNILISLHADAHKNPKTRGLSVYTLSERRANYEKNQMMKKADREEVIRGVDLKNESDDLQHTIIDLAQRHTKNTSYEFADMVVNNLGNEAKLLRNTLREASLEVLTGADIPSVLVELGYLSNRYEEKLLRTDEHMIRLLAGIKRSIDSYFKKYPLEK